jgi:hypothetical protein
MSESVAFSRVDIESDVANYIANNAVMIYWHHEARQLTYIIAEDTMDYRGEMRRLKSAIRDGRILSVRSGETITISSVSLFPVLLEFRDQQCPAYFLLSQSAMGEFVDFTPYFFRSSRMRDAVLTYLQN